MGNFNIKKPKSEQEKIGRVKLPSKYLVGEESKHNWGRQKKSNKKPRTKAIADHQEGLMARLLQGRTTKASKKGDVEFMDMLAECKVTGKEQITVKKSYLEKIAKDAMAKGRVPCIIFGFDKNVFGTDNHWIAMPVSVFEDETCKK